MYAIAIAYCLFMAFHLIPIAIQLFAPKLIFARVLNNPGLSKAPIQTQVNGFTFYRMLLSMSCHHSPT